MKTYSRKIFTIFSSAILINAILIFSIAAFGQEQKPTPCDVMLGDSQAQVQKYVAAALKIQDQSWNQIKAEQDTIRILRDSIKSAAKKK